MSGKRQLHLGLMFWGTGTHPSGWRWPTAKADAAYDIEYLQTVTRLAEDAKFDFVFLGDKLATDPSLQRSNPAQMSRLEPFIAGASLAAATSRIGIVVTANPTYYDPYTLARLFSSLDHLSKGRASWSLVTGADPDAAANFSRDEHWNADRRYDRADEFVAIVKDLWDGWEDDAVSRTDGKTSADRERIHPVGTIQQHFDVTGPLDSPRSPQGHPVILHAGTSERSRELGARDADAIFTHHGTIASAKSYYDDIKSRAARYGRQPDDIAILPSLTPIVAETTEAAIAIFDALNAFIQLDAEDAIDGGGVFGNRGAARSRNLTAASKSFGVDLTGHGHDDIVEPTVLEGVSADGKRLLAEITRLTRRSLDGSNRITYRDLILAATIYVPSVVGNPIEVADFIEEWFVSRAADGFNLFPAYVPGAIEAFTRLVVPELQRRGIYRHDYEGTTFRSHLGLERPDSRFASARQSKRKKA